MKSPPINLVLLKRTNTSEPSFFDDAAHSVEYLLRLAGYKTYVSCNTVAPDALNIVWGAHAHFSPPLAEILSVAKPEFTIIFNMEQIELGNSFVSREYLDFLSNYRVLDYNVANIKRMTELSPNIMAKEFPLLPSMWMASDFSLSGCEVATDVAFWGAPSDRRTAVLKRLDESGYITRYINDAYGHHLSRRIFEAKVCLNIHALKTGIFEVARCLRPMAMGLPIISEISILPELVDWKQSGIIFCDYEEIPGVTKDLLRNPVMASSLSRKTHHFLNRKIWSDLASDVIASML